MVLSLHKHSEEISRYYLWPNAMKEALQTACNTLKSFSIGTLKTVNFPFVPSGKLMVLSVPIFKLNIVLGCNLPKFWDT